ncbi:hypothetical protein [Dyadobacter sandarakinus]|uniref:Superinfection exclusion protein B n=1 Tax=Dyadobacter sandarakinus TaxID=2747268 RepID=A0ABX7I8N5_9BACT|nr:hypothetical protein [Dyadobacter sandarakinus]QRR02464.1 hypothetical protein HWI92_16880 [Dyadobacter sandarakinus]
MDWFWKFWKDSVWSKVIANVIWDYVRPWIIPLIASIGAFIWKSVDKKGFLTFIEYPISFPLWVGLLTTLIVWLVLLFVKNWRKKRAVVPRNPIWDTQIGDYTFEELYRELNQKLRVRTSKMDNLGIAPPDTLIITQFKEHYDKFNKGLSGGETLMLMAMGELNMNDGGYIVDVLAPKLTEYGLLTETKNEQVLSGKSYLIVTYRISDLGYEFYDCLQVVHPLAPQLIYRADHF